MGDQKICETNSQQSAGDDVSATLAYLRIDRQRGLTLAHRSRPAGSTTEIFARFPKTGQFCVPEFISGS
ncbi:hypothetical protein TNCV_1865881 [Trichonephila clavipes]|nr:hypothetical protein TNCV_1865881 [Trichonephila clavipes]